MMGREAIRLLNERIACPDQCVKHIILNPALRIREL